MAEITVDISVKCANCNQILSSSSTKQGDVIEVEPCPKCFERDLDDAREKGYQDGHSDGYEEGFDKGLKETRYIKNEAN